MPDPALKRATIVDTAVPLATLTVAGIAIASRAVGDHTPTQLHDGFATVSTLCIDGGLSPAVAGAIAVVLFLASVVSRRSGFASSAVAAFYRCCRRYKS
jgi:hypothetical protein